MDSLILHPPGAARGPCATACAHTICAAQRALAAFPCPICNQPIGYDEPFIPDLDLTSAAHYDCAEQAAVKGAA